MVVGSGDTDKTPQFSELWSSAFVMLNSFFLSVWNNPIHQRVQTLGSLHCGEHKLSQRTPLGSILLPFKGKLTGLVCEVRQGRSSWRLAAQQQPLRSSQITSGCKLHRSAPQQPASLSTHSRQGLKIGLHHACTVLVGMSSPVAPALAGASCSQWSSDESQMKLNQRVCGAPAEVKSGNLKYSSKEETAQLRVFFPPSLSDTLHQTWYRASLHERPKYNSESQWNTNSQNLIKQLERTDFRFTDFHEVSIKYLTACRDSCRW